jgi:hypothetical protein
MDNVQKVNNCINIPLLLTFKSYIQNYINFKGTTFESYTEK